jgi:phenylacetate-CoA ligase
MLLPSEQSIVDFLREGRQNSPFYKELYKELPDGISNIEELPLTDSDSYWAACRSKPHGVLMGRLDDGLVMRTGGSTAEPKLVYATRDELRRAAQVLGAGMSQYCGLVPGDRIANMMRHGAMYGGFAYANAVLLEMPMPHVHLPITGNELPPDATQQLIQNEATVILSNVFTVVRLADYLRTNNQTLPLIRLILYTGEAFFKELRPLFKAAFPNAKVHPSMYACVDSGLVGIPANPPLYEDDDISPTYRSIAPFDIMELIAEDGSSIKEPGKRGHVYITHVVKKKLPMIRYPVGDLAEWVDYEHGLFKLYGRDHVDLKVGTAHIDLPLLRHLMEKALGSGVIDSFQTIVRRDDRAGASILTFRIAAPKPPEDPGRIGAFLEAALKQVVPSWTRNRENGHIGPIELEFCQMKDLVTHEKTGKLKNFIDERFAPTVADGSNGAAASAGATSGNGTA